MKRITDLKNLNVQVDDVVLNDDLQNLIDKLIVITKELNQNSVNRKEYNIHFEPQISNGKVENIDFTLTVKHKSLFSSDEPNIETPIFSGSSADVFYAYEGVSGYRTTSELSQYHYRQIEEVQFKDSFYNTTNQFLAIVEDFMIDAFLKNEQEASQKSKFDSIVTHRKMNIS